MAPAARVALVALQSALAAVVYGVVTHGRPLIAAGTGATLGASLSFLEVGVLLRWDRVGLQRLPFALYFALRVALYLAIVVAVLYAATQITGGGVSGEAVERRDIEFAVFVCVTMNLLFSVNELLGPGVLFAFAAGRYRRPRREERALLYLDLCGSTALAEQLGEERFLGFLNAFFADVTEEIEAQGGEIHKYVGDEVIAVWRAGTSPTKPIAACFAADARLARRAAAYRAEFGATPAFRAAIHAGAVVIGELGASKKEIALIGDAMNTAARILEAARATGASVLISAAYFDSASPAPPGLSARRLAPIALRGKAAPLPLISLEPDRPDLSAAAASI